MSSFGLAGPAQSSQLVCRILTLTLGPLDLNLLGLRVQLNQLNLRITAIPGGGLLGDLLCGVANLLNPPALGGGNLASVLNALLALVPTNPAPAGARDPADPGPWRAPSGALHDRARARRGHMVEHGTIQRQSGNEEAWAPVSSGSLLVPRTKKARLCRASVVRPK